MKSKKPNLKYFYEFGSTCFILNDREQRSNFDAKSNEDISLGYSFKQSSVQSLQQKDQRNHGIH